MFNIKSDVENELDENALATRSAKQTKMNDSFRHAYISFP